MRQGRHSRSKYDWGTEPSRSVERSTEINAQDQDAKRSPARKDRRGYCKSARGPHVESTVKRSTYKEAPCGWRPSWYHRSQQWRAVWRCFHHVECVACGKHLHSMVGRQCPEWHGITPDEQQQVDARNSTDAISTRLRRFGRIKPPITGPQGYRRNRQNGAQ